MRGWQFFYFYFCYLTLINTWILGSWCLKKAEIALSWKEKSLYHETKSNQNKIVKSYFFFLQNAHKKLVLISHYNIIKNKNKVRKKKWYKGNLSNLFSWEEKVQANLKYIIHTFLSSSNSLWRTPNSRKTSNFKLSFNR